MDKQTVSRIITVLGTIFVGIGQVLRDLDKEDQHDDRRRQRRRRRR